MYSFDFMLSHTFHFTLNSYWVVFDDWLEIGPWKVILLDLFLWRGEVTQFVKETELSYKWNIFGEEYSETTSGFSKTKPRRVKYLTTDKFIWEIVKLHKCK